MKHDILKAMVQQIPTVIKCKTLTVKENNYGRGCGGKSSSTGKMSHQEICFAFFLYAFPSSTSTLLSLHPFPEKPDLLQHAEQSLILCQGGALWVCP